MPSSLARSRLHSLPVRAMSTGWRARFGSSCDAFFGPLRLWGLNGQPTKWENADIESKKSLQKLKGASHERPKLAAGLPNIARTVKPRVSGVNERQAVGKLHDMLPRDLLESSHCAGGPIVPT